MRRLCCGCWGGIKDTSKNPWKDISNELPFFTQFVIYSVGNEVDTYFWKDKWLGDRSLCSSFFRNLMSSMRNY